ncbi:MAG TPA: DUF5703 domain-containing protein [Sumerlaeia bacterium]|nr:DUF5703 domain-containing protein [Sumerlaeia bacterium]
MRKAVSAYWAMGACLSGFTALAAPGGASSAEEDPLDVYNVAWDSPSSNSRQSMPIGNGDIGLNVWVEEGGALLFYIGKTDAWDERGELLKLGRVRVSFSPNPFEKGLPFRQVLKLRQGEIAIRAGEESLAMDLRVWVDANRPLIHVEATGQRVFRIEAAVERWRESDQAVPFSDGRAIWFHRNETSDFASRLKAHNLAGLEQTYRDPLLNRTFGGLMQVRGTVVKRDDPGALFSPLPRKSFDVQIHVLTDQTPTVEEWQERLERSAVEFGLVGVAASRKAHQAWWGDFWNRSWIRVATNGDRGGRPSAESASEGKEREASPPAEGHLVSQAYVLQRFISASSGRGAYPIKFNGSIFTVEYPDRDNGNPDFRAWGPDYWLQNTRLPYWPLIASGDFDMLQPLYRMYTRTLPLQKERTKRYFGHSGAYFPETMSFWGLSRDGDYGTDPKDREGQPISWHKNGYIRREWQGGIEVLAMMLDYYAYALDEAFLKNHLLPYANEIITFYDEHYKRDEKGKILFHPAQALETWWDCTNPMPEIAGLKFTLAKLAALPDELTSETQRAKWRKMLQELPPIPTREEDGKVMLSPAGKFETKQNSENPELYAVFPYRLYGVGKPDIEIARLALEKRQHAGPHGWRQDETQMAFLGLAEQARDYVVQRAAQKNKDARFPAIWGPNMDWTPDQTHGGNLMMALQTMLMQCEGDAIRLFPAWPKEWDVDFKLRAPKQTIVEGTLRSGKLERLKVAPKAREKDVIVLEPQ